MNIPVLICAAIMTLVVTAHVVGVTRETVTLEPASKAGRLMAHWVQAMCAFQMLTLDLIVLTALLYTLALSELLQPKGTILYALAGYFALQGVIWLGNVIYLRRSGATVLSLPHWTVWFVIAGLLLWGASGSA